MWEVLAPELRLLVRFPGKADQSTAAVRATGTHYWLQQMVQIQPLQASLLRYAVAEDSLELCPVEENQVPQR
ncbi:uncharacterized protein N7529_000730 [Penicillium soppii]|uniref:uncharacterized protein n=1 Tax=Penicillium soppii TaxID=69789 RepID=UPI00254940BB|nr:uncharacterized protein N7529_000730 [Penicillium soppii]KAJ5882058.1 hypothetical protein N7529_000730 [Penicillium soppii]